MRTIAGFAVTAIFGLLFLAAVAFVLKLMWKTFLLGWALV